MSEHSPIVSIKNLFHRYGKDWAIQNINIEITETGIVGLLGSNGAGKSTTMNILCGVISPTKGSAGIAGHDLKSDPMEAKKQLGFLPQQAPLHLELTVDEYLRHCAQLRQIPRNNVKQAIERTKEYCGVTQYSKRLIGNLSGGYKQRVGIAQAIIHEPQLVVLDEPTNGLDPVQITEVKSLIRDLGKNCAVLLSTHILSEVQATCERIIMIESGKGVFDGTMKEFNNLITPNKLVVKMSATPSLQELEAIEGVEAVEHNEIEDVIHLRITPNKNVGGNLIEIGVKNSWGLSEVHLEKVSLDSVFAKLSNRELKS